ncbi:non-structural maintenance of chromosomes element 1 homolog [Uranotaenia lowii]|uniref:non-structural maintenance of chromosomes element 1 homolog n=1 Tax=Uranotaenia lowii TaxID=190385 RepID=UPI00247980D9|nr:non-structural maintenance of chromosomes element 1 homolog [Uranotaenia lowii]
MVSAYSNIHCAFLQSCVHHGIIELEDALKFLTRLYKTEKPNDDVVNPTQISLRILVAEINLRISKYDQKLVLFDCEPSLKTFIIFVNISNTGFNRFQTAYSNGELNLFRLILQALAKSQAHQISQIECLNLTAQIPRVRRAKRVTKSRAEELMHDWCLQGYLVLGGDVVRFGPRTIVEFKPYLINHFPGHIKVCRLCKDAVFYGTSCAECKEQMHKKCLTTYIKRMKKCPACKKQWKA